MLCHAICCWLIVMVAHCAEIIYIVTYYLYPQNCVDLIGRGHTGGHGLFMLDQTGVVARHVYHSNHKTIPGDSD